MRQLHHPNNHKGYFVFTVLILYLIATSGIFIPTVAWCCVKCESYDERIVEGTVNCVISDENAKDRQRSYLNERKKLVNEVCRLPVLPEISSSWNDLLRKLNIDHKLHEAMEKYPLDAKLQRLFLLDWYV